MFIPGVLVRPVPSTPRLLVYLSPAVDVIDVEPNVVEAKEKVEQNVGGAAVLFVAGLTEGAPFH